MKKLLSPPVHQFLSNKSGYRRAVCRFLFFMLLIAVGNPTIPSQAQTGWIQPVDLTQSSTSKLAIYPTLVCDPYQNTHVLWADRTEGGAEIFYRNDISGEWSIPSDVLAISSADALRLSSAVSKKNDTLHLIWVDLWIRGDLYYSQAPLQKASDTRAWSQPVLIAENLEAGDITADKDGNLHIAYEATDNSGYEVGVNYIYSEDAGLSWSNPVPVFVKTVRYPSSAVPHIAVDDTNRVHIGVAIRSQEYGVSSEVGYIRSLDGGKTWSDYKIVDDDSTTFQGIAVLDVYAFGENEIHLTWHDPRRMHQFSLDGGGTWSEPDEIMPLGGAFGGPNALARDSAGNIHVVTAVRGSVYSATWDGTSWSAPERIESRGIDPHGQDILICQGNNLQVVYDDRNDQGKVWYSRRILNTPVTSRKPMPVLPDSPTPEVNTQENQTPQASGTNAPLEAATPAAYLQEPAPSIRTPVMPILISTIPVLALIFFVVVSLFRRR